VEEEDNSGLDTKKQQGVGWQEDKREEIKECDGPIRARKGVREVGREVRG